MMNSLFSCINILAYLNHDCLALLRHTVVIGSHSCPVKCIRIKFEPATMVSTWESSLTFICLIISDQLILLLVGEYDITYSLVQELNCAIQEWLSICVSGNWLNTFIVNRRQKIRSIWVTSSSSNFPFKGISSIIFLRLFFVGWSSRIRFGFLLEDGNLPFVIFKLAFVILAMLEWLALFRLFLLVPVHLDLLSTANLHVPYLILIFHQWQSFVLLNQLVKFSNLGCLNGTTLIIDRWGVITRGQLTKMSIFEKIIGQLRYCRGKVVRTGGIYYRMWS